MSNHTGDCPNVFRDTAFETLHTTGDESGDVTAHPAIIAVQASPTVLTLTLLLLLLPHHRRSRALTLNMVVAGQVLSLGATVAQMFLVWRMFERLVCDEHLTRSQATNWGVVAISVMGLSHILAILVFGSLYPRSTIGIVLSIASGVVVLDCAFRGWWISTSAADPLMAVQQLYCFLAVTILWRVFGSARIASSSTPGNHSSSSRRSTMTTQIDPLQHHDETPRGWSWFMGV